MYSNRINIEAYECVELSEEMSEDFSGIFHWGCVLGLIDADRKCVFEL